MYNVYAWQMSFLDQPVLLASCILSEGYSLSKPLNKLQVSYILDTILCNLVEGVTAWMFEEKLAVLYLAEHFLLGFAVASLAFWLMQTIFSGVLGRGTYRFSLLVALSCAVVAHILEDYFLSWF
jgi:hypothetical protein